MKQQRIKQVVTSPELNVSCVEEINISGTSGKYGLHISGNLTCHAVIIERDGLRKAYALNGEELDIASFPCEWTED